MFINISVDINLTVCNLITVVQFVHTYRHVFIIDCHKRTLFWRSNLYSSGGIVVNRHALGAARTGRKHPCSAGEDAPPERIVGLCISFCSASFMFLPAKKTERNNSNKKLQVPAAAAEWSSCPRCWSDVSIEGVPVKLPALNNENEENGLFSKDVQERLQK